MTTYDEAPTRDLTPAQLDSARLIGDRVSDPGGRWGVHVAVDGDFGGAPCSRWDDRGDAVAEAIRIGVSLGCRAAVSDTV